MFVDHIACLEKYRNIRNFLYGISSVLYYEQICVSLRINKIEKKFVLITECKQNIHELKKILSFQ